MRKKAVSGVIVIVLFIILIIAMIFILWAFLRSFMRKQMEISEIKTELLNIQVDIHKADIKDNILSLTLSRGGGEFRIKNITKIIKKADIVFVIDSTASMKAEIKNVTSVIQNFADKLAGEEIDYRLALVEFQDYNEEYCGIPSAFPNKTYYFSGGSPFTKDIAAYKAALPNVSPAGGDTPESHLTALESAANLPFRVPETKTYKFIIMLTDAPPHAQECSVISLGYRFSTLQDSGGTYYQCYKGPRYVQNITDLLVSKEITFYYINKLTNASIGGGLCDNDPIVNGMVPATHGKVFGYTEAGGVQNIILQLASQIIIEYEKEKYDHIKVIIYNATTSCEKKIPFPPEYLPPPMPLETRTYNISLADCVSNPTRIELYPVILTSDGVPVIGQLMDSIDLKK